ncbi:MAG: hypothetical protein V3T70_03575, partial [Phycisphaerae bacterium]
MRQPIGSHDTGNRGQAQKHAAGRRRKSPGGASRLRRTRVRRFRFQASALWQPPMDQCDELLFTSAGAPRVLWHQTRAGTPPRRLTTDTP